MTRLAGLFLLTALGCGSDGQTPRCDGFPETFDLRDQAAREAAWRELEELAGPPYHCVTLPAGFPDQDGVAAAGSAGDTSGD